MLPTKTVFRTDMKLTESEERTKIKILSRMTWIGIKNQLFIKEVTLYFSGKLSCWLNGIRKVYLILPFMWNLRFRFCRAVSHERALAFRWESQSFQDSPGVLRPGEAWGKKQRSRIPFQQLSVTPSEDAT